MQNRYVGDIGDFGKYGLLRALCGAPEPPTGERPLRLGVVWYLYPDETHNADGKYTSYLTATSINRTRFAGCDPALYKVLGRLVATDSRHVVGIRESGILPSDTTYYERSLSYSSEDRRAARQHAREDWLQGALRVTADSEVIFADPDNGISETTDPLHKKGPKFTYLEDLRRFSSRGKSLVIYHHLARHDTAIRQIRHVASRLQATLEMSCLPWSLWYHRGSARAYFIVPNDRHKDVLESRLSGFLEGSWGEHFEFVD